VPDAVGARVLRALRGEKDAEEWIAHRAYTAGLRLATFSLNDPSLAQDVAQEVAIRVLAGLPKLRDADRFDAWTYRISAREIKRAAKNRQRQESREDDVDVLEAAHGPSFSESLGERDWLTRALAELSERQRLVLGLRYVSGLDDEEIGKAIGARRGTVRSLASRGIASLRMRAEREGESAAAAVAEKTKRNRVEAI
jgi:RNA polymerase sigma factor (sigma-70 family)